ncbi:hypothetical protein QM012_002703 [Aureobasidium pullulans]|uniref:C2H2-type domain-containing protein n=1 Tax=Aureobasidium pullulans TaxID=5580 RepID=A0ABR0TB72_AURPU
MDESQVNQMFRGAAQNDDRNAHLGSHDEQHQHSNPMFGGADANQSILDQDPTLDDFSNAPFDYASLSSLYIPSSELTTDFVSAIPPMETFEPSYDLLGTAEGKGLEIPHGWSNEYMDAAPLASSLANREIRKSGKSWSQLLAEQRKASHSSGLPRRRSRYRLNRMDSSSSTPSIPIPESSSTERYDPLQRYQNSPPEDDYVSMAAVEQALQSSEFDILDSDHVSQPAEVHYPGRGRRSRPGSIASVESAASSPSVRSSNSAASSISARSRSARRRPQRTRKPKTQSDKAHIFKCTFCCDTFYKRYDWSRHERSLHLNLEVWLCCPQGGSVFSEATGRNHCAYCQVLDPTLEHLDSHDHSNCVRSSRRQFNRKDHLVQHLRLFHRLQTMPLIDDWKTQGPNITSRCGFCDRRMTNWDERIEHLSGHFRAGRTMKDWRGDHEFEPEIAARVTNAIPPYLIGDETETLVPFSSTSHVVRDHVAQISSRLTAMPSEPSEPTSPLPLTPEMEVPSTQSNNLTLNEMVIFHLGRYGRQQLSLGITPTDEMFQNEARRLLYDSEDPWNQSLVDNPE